MFQIGYKNILHNNNIKKMMAEKREREKKKRKILEKLRFI